MRLSGRGIIMFVLLLLGINLILSGTALYEFIHATHGKVFSAVTLSSSVISLSVLALAMNCIFLVFIACCLWEALRRIRNA